MQHGINVVAVVFNDSAYGNVARDLDEAWGGSYGAELRNPDFMKLADAFGLAGFRAKQPTDVGNLVRDALKLDRPALIEVPVGRMPRPLFFAQRSRPPSTSAERGIAILSAENSPKPLRKPRWRSTKRTKRGMGPGR